MYNLIHIGIWLIIAILIFVYFYIYKITPKDTIEFNTVTISELINEMLEIQKLISTHKYTTRKETKLINNRIIKIKKDVQSYKLFNNIHGLNKNITRQMKNNINKHQHFKKEESEHYVKNIFVEPSVYEKEVIVIINFLEDEIDNLIKYITMINKKKQEENIHLLAVINIIFLPLGFITGYYKMNFITKNNIINSNYGEIWFFILITIYASLFIYIINNLTN